MIERAIWMTVGTCGAGTGVTGVAASVAERVDATGETGLAAAAVVVLERLPTDDDAAAVAGRGLVVLVFGVGESSVEESDVVLTEGRRVAAGEDERCFLTVGAGLDVALSVSVLSSLAVSLAVGDAAFGGFGDVDDFASPVDCAVVSADVAEPVLSSAQAMPGWVATAAPTPNATASAPTRPMVFA